MSKTLKVIKWCLIILAGVVVLGSLLLVTGGWQRELARRTCCLNNLKQLGMSLAMYADSYQGRLPMDSKTPTLVGSMQLLSDVLTTGYLLHCPDDNRPSARPVGDLAKLGLDNISYSYVPNQIWQKEGSNVIVMLDRIYSTKKGSKWPPNGNHAEHGGNILFADGHVEWQAKLPADLKGKDGEAIVLSP